ncbi:hypothetical protein PO909_014578 [Leuciscus waleckii]
MSCGSCRATLRNEDRHLLCASCLGRDHVDHALANAGCRECEALPLSTLRARQALFSSESAPPMLPVGLRRKKKRRSQRPPDTSVREPSPAASPRASLSESPVSFIDGQRPALSTRESSVRASVDAELLRLLTKTVEDLGLEWTAPQEPAPNRLDGCFLPGRRSSPVLKPAPFLPELHDMLSRSWGAPYSARLWFSVSSALSAVDDAKERGYLSIPPVEEAVAIHLCPPSAGWRSKSSLPTKACRTTSALLLPPVKPLLRYTPWRFSKYIRPTFSAPWTRLARRQLRHLWLTLSDMSDSDLATFLDAPVPSGLFGPSVKGFTEHYSKVQKASQAMRHFLPRRSSSAAGRAKETSAAAASAACRTASPGSGGTSALALH